MFVIGKKNLIILKTLFIESLNKRVTYGENLLFLFLKLTSLGQAAMYMVSHCGLFLLVPACSGLFCLILASCD